MPWAQNLAVLAYINLFAENLKMLNHEILMMKYCSTDKAYIQYRQETCSFCWNVYIQIGSPQLLCQILRMLYVLLDVQFLVLIVCSRYICMKRTLAIIIYYAKVIYEPWCLMELIDTWDPFNINCWINLDKKYIERGFLAWSWVHVHRNAKILFKH